MATVRYPPWRDGAHLECVHVLSLLEYNSKRTATDLAIWTLANDMFQKLGHGPELANGLRKLMEAQDCFARQYSLDNMQEEWAEFHALKRKLDDNA